jgi:ribonuclease HI
MGTFDLRSLKIYVDGSCLKNPGGPGGWCAWVEFPFDWGRPDVFVESRGYFQTTNNRMELRAVLFAHEWVLGGCDGSEVQHVQIASDSKYVCENYGRSQYWAGDDWCNRDGREMLNVDLWKELLRIRRKISGRPRVEVMKIDRRSCQLAKNVDDGAKLAARSPQHTDGGFRPGKVGRSRNNNNKAAALYPAAGEEIIICVYKTEPTRRGVQTVRFQTYSEEKRDFFEKFYARADYLIGNSLHRGHAFQVRMNAEPRNPRIVEIIAELNKAELVGTPEDSEE